MDHGEARKKEMEDDDHSHSSPRSGQYSAHDSDDPKERDDNDGEEYDDADEEEEEEEEEHDEEEHEDTNDDDHDGGGGGEDARLTRRNSVNLDSVAGDKKTEASAAAATVTPAPGGDGSGGGDTTRALLDSIRQEHDANAGVTPAVFAINRNSFKDRLPSRRPGPISDPELVVSVRPSPSIIARSISRSVSIRNTEATYPESAAATGRSALLSEFNPAHIGSAAEQEESNDAADNGSSIFGGTAEAPAGNEDQPVRVSLMALLGQTDGEWGDGSPSESPMGGDDEDEEDDDDAEEENGSGMEYECCVCMVRHKGSAFIPCGHTFCRLCSRELWVSRGNCPLCNGYILEILDIF